MSSKDFYYKLKFYLFLLHKADQDKLSDFEDYNNISASSATRWKRDFDKELFLQIITKSWASNDVRSMILKAIEEKALNGDIQAAKLILSEDPKDDDEETNSITPDEALKILREVFARANDKIQA